MRLCVEEDSNCCRSLNLDRNILELSFLYSLCKKLSAGLELRDLSCHILSFPQGWRVYGVLHHLSRIWWSNHHLLQHRNCF